MTRTARALVWAATLALPRGAVRERYRLEHHGELSVLAATDQTRCAVGVRCTATTPPDCGSWASCASSAPPWWA